MKHVINVHIRQQLVGKCDQRFAHIFLSDQIKSHNQIGKLRSAKLFWRIEYTYLYAAFTVNHAQNVLL